ncbi:MAG: di-trans,poly-cis-decaprenylcistransferase, partial [Thiothrix sp.]|nr:di-trans,poly-cis-decaprenylcistransferase [Thiothrix sp.]
RPEEEVSGLMSLFMTVLERETAGLLKHQVRMRFIGDRSGFSSTLQQKIAEVEAETCSGNGMVLQIAANYGGRWDIMQAVRTLIQAVQAQELESSGITESMLEKYLSTAGVPEPDLFIRTGGEQRISNFLLWQLAYSELYFSDCLWPEFDEKAIQQAFDAYASRQRRFGMTGDQVRRSAPHA